MTFPENLEQSNAALFNSIRNYISHLELMTGRLISQTINFISKGSDFTSHNYEDILKECAAVVIFLHPDFDDDESLRLELEEINQQFGLEDFNPVLHTPKVFKIYLEPFKEAVKPDGIEKLLPYTFYERNPYNKKIKRLEFDDEKTNPVIYSKLLDLANDIRYAILNKSQPESDNEIGDRCVFLGYSTDDQLESISEIRRELQDLGYKVLPLVNLPASHEALETLIVTNLQYTKACIQLMGVQYGDLVKGTKYSLIEFQNKIIKEYQESHPEQHLQRYIWIPLASKINDQRQMLYLKRLKRDDANQNTEIIESAIEMFKTFLLNHLDLNFRHTADGFENERNVYLVSENDIPVKSDRLYASLSSAGLRVFTLDYKEQTGIYVRHLQALRKCDNVIIYQQNDNPYWLNSKLRDLVKAPGLGRQHPFRKIILISASKADDELTRTMNPKPEILHGSNIDTDLVLQKLTIE